MTTYVDPPTPSAPMTPGRRRPSPSRPGDRPARAGAAGRRRDGPSLAAHRRQYGDVPGWTATSSELVGRVRLRGRGGAAFPFATKLETLRRGRRPVVVVNLSEGEPASSKDAALALIRPHLVLDGAVATARALHAREVHVVLPGDRPAAAAAMRTALAERDDRGAGAWHVASRGSSPDRPRRSSSCSPAGRTCR